MAGKLVAFDQALLFYLHRLFTNQSTEVVHASPHGLGLLLNLDLGNIGAVNRKHFFDAFAVGNTTHGKCFLNARTLPGDYYASENLDALLVAFSHQRVYFDPVAYLESGNLSLELVLVQIFNNLVHYINPLVNLVSAFASFPLVRVDATSRFLRDFRIKAPLESACLDTQRDA